MNAHFQKILSEMETTLGVKFDVGSDESLHFHFKDHLRVVLRLHDELERVTVDAILDEHAPVYSSVPENLNALLLQLNYGHRDQRRPYAALDAESRIVLTQSKDLVQLDGIGLLLLIEQAVLDVKQLDRLLNTMASEESDQTTELPSNVLPLSTPLIKI